VRSRNKRNLIVEKQNLSQPIYPHTKSLHDSEAALRNYYSHVTSLIQKEVPHQASSILDFGAGLGTLARIIQMRTNIIVDCVEIDPSHQHQLLKENFLVYTTLDATQKSYDFIYSKDTLEHIENDLETLRELAQHLSERGKLVIYVPAMPAIFSELDEIVGHFRRYDKTDLVEKIRSAGFEVKKYQYVDSLGFLVGLMLRHFSRSRMDQIINVRMFGIYDKLIFPISRMFDILGGNRVAGKNILVVAQLAPKER
jgi:SAM-dependent methyltransferase